MFPTRPIARSPRNLLFFVSLLWQYLDKPRYVRRLGNARAIDTHARNIAAFYCRFFFSSGECGTVYMFNYLQRNDSCRKVKIAILPLDRAAYLRFNNTAEFLVRSLGGCREISIYQRSNCERSSRVGICVKNTFQRKNIVSLGDRRSNYFQSFLVCLPFSRRWPTPGANRSFCSGCALSKSRRIFPRVARLEIRSAPGPVFPVKKQLAYQFHGTTRCIAGNPACWIVFLFLAA